MDENLPQPPTPPIPEEPTGNNILPVIITSTLILAIVVVVGYFFVFKKSGVSQENIQNQNISQIDISTTTPAQQASSTAAIEPLSQIATTTQKTTPKVSTVSTQTTPVKTTPLTEDKNLIAQSVITMGENKTFQLKDYPGVQFTLKRIALGKGGVTITRCGSEAKFISVKIPNQQPSGNCINAEDYNGVTPAVLFIGFEISNNSGQYVGGDFVEVLYTTTVNGQQVTRKAQADPPWSGFGADAFSSRTLPMGFVIPIGQEEVSIIYGNYADKYGTHYGNDFEKTEGGFIVNFKNKTITNISG